jgi:FKBP-type peptidyl-prolyl cis-trans isomerase FkpA
MTPPSHRRCALLTAWFALAALAASADPGAAGSEAGEKRGSHVEIVTASGLRYTDLRPGQGAEATEGKIVEVHYTGWLENGKKFDSTENCKSPFTFRIGAGDVIKGLDEGVTGMREGGKRRLVIPPELGLGKQGGGGVIPPNATLTYEVELLSVR